MLFDLLFHVYQFFFTMYTYVSTYIYIYKITMYVCMYVWTDGQMDLCRYIYTYILCINVYIYIYISAGPKKIYLWGIHCQFFS